MKKFLWIFILVLCSVVPAHAEKISVKIAPAQLISTCHDELEVGDYVRFKTVYDVYKNNKLYIKKDSPVVAVVDHVSENGWGTDNAQLDFKKFKTRDINGNIITINSPLSINGLDILKYKHSKFKQFFNYAGYIFLRGKEVEIIPSIDNVTFNIWLTI